MPDIAFVQAITRTADGKALIIKQLANTPDEQDFVMLVIAAVTAPLDRLQLGEFLFPVAQHMRLDATKLAHLTDGEVALGRNGRQFLAASRFMPWFHRKQVQRRTSAFDWHGKSPHGVP